MQGFSTGPVYSDRQNPVKLPCIPHALQQPRSQVWEATWCPVAQPGPLGLRVCKARPGSPQHSRSSTSRQSEPEFLQWDLSYFFTFFPLQLGKSLHCLLDTPDGQLLWCWAHTPVPPAPPYAQPQHSLWLLGTRTQVFRSSSLHLQALFHNDAITHLDRGKTLWKAGAPGLFRHRSWPLSLFKWRARRAPGMQIIKAKTS